MMDLEPFIQVARERTSTDPAHDFLHVQRVLNNAQRILAEMEADREIVEPATLLHELFNYPKGHPDAHLSGDVRAEQAALVLDELHYPRDKREWVLDCIRNHSFSRGVVPAHVEGRIVQEADRLDAIGAIGIARLFATCEAMGRPFYDAADPFAARRPPDDKAFGVDHFYGKLFRLADGMHTEVARRLAAQRTAFMHDYLAQLRLEIDAANEAI